MAPSKDSYGAIFARNECEDYCRNDSNCWGCSLSKTPFGWNAIPDCGDLQSWPGYIEGDVSRKHHPGKCKVIPTNAKLIEEQY